MTGRDVADLANPVAMKTDLLRWRRMAHPQLLIGIGNQASDAQAYHAAGMLSLIISQANHPPQGVNVVPLPDWHAVHAFFRTQAPLLRSPERLEAFLRAGRGAELAPRTTALLNSQS